MRNLIKDCCGGSLIHRYLQDRSGQFAVWIGVLALPIMVITTYAVDYSRAESLKYGLQDALDLAALASVTEQRLDAVERAEYAKDYFTSNFSHADKFVLTPVHTSGERVELYAEGTSPVSVSRAIGREDFKVSATSVSELTKGATICVMTLNPDGSDSFSVTGGADFDASSCAVQVNSINNGAAVVDASSSATAQRFCVRGAAQGDFTPYVNTECSLIANPFASKPAPEAESCLATAMQNFRSLGQQYRESSSESVEDFIGNGFTLSPGTYCKPLVIVGVDVTFLPGVYVFDDAPIRFVAGSQAIAEDVTFVLSGTRSDLLVDGGSSLYMKAPSDGDYAGLAVFQDVTTNITGQPGKGSGILPNGKTELRGGSTMTILGTIYVPEHDIIVSSDSGLGTQSPATSFIGYNVNFSGNSRITVAVDAASVGLPPILPKADEGARLVQ